MGKKVAPLRVVVDTNVLVSALLFGGGPGRVYDLWLAKRVVPLLSRETFAEFSKVLAYPKFRLSAVEIATILEDELLPYTDVIDIAEAIEGVCRDSHDDRFLALAASGKADYLVTGDKDLLAIASFRDTQIVTVSQFLELL